MDLKEAVNNCFVTPHKAWLLLTFFVCCSDDSLITVLTVYHSHLLVAWHQEKKIEWP